MKKNKFNPGVRISIFFVFFAIVFFSLGLWQIERGQSKTDLLKEFKNNTLQEPNYLTCLLYTSPSPRDRTRSRMPSSA